MIDLSPKLSLPIEAVTQTFAFLGRRGSGKSYAAGKLAEGMLDAKAQIVALDPVGVWWGLRLAANGKGKGFSIPVFGGQHGDVQITPDSGAVIADLVVDRGISLVLDVSMFRKNEMKRFVTDFAEHLYQRKKSARTAMHLFVEEAQVFVPQRAMGDEARMLGAFESLIKLGRNFGIGCTLISQRPQAVNKDALNQTEVLVALQTTGPQERKAIAGWIVDQGLDLNLVNTLPSLAIGEAWVWSPQWLNFSERIKIGKKKTFNASATPEVGAAAVEAKALAPVDLDEIRGAIEATVKAAEQNDPKALRAEIERLKRELYIADQKAPQVERVEVPVFKPEELEKVQELMKDVDAMKEMLSAIGVRQPSPKPFVPMSVGYRYPLLEDSIPPKGVYFLGDQHTTHVTKAQARREREDRKTQDRVAATGSTLRSGERKMLDVLARGWPIRRTPAQVGSLAGFTPSGGTFRTYMGTLKREGLVAEQGGLLMLTEKGVQEAGGVQRPDTLEHWREVLRAGEWKMLEYLIGEHPHRVPKEKLGLETGFAASGGTFRTYLGTLVRNDLVVVEGGAVAAADSLPTWRAA